MNIRFPIFTLIAWLIFYAGRPFRLGFYYDDWAFIVSLADYRFAELWVEWQGVMPTRPLGRLTLSICTDLFGTSAFAWHVALAATALANAILIYEVARRLTTDRKRYVPEADIAAACWLVMPWLLSTTAWPILIIAQASVMFVLLSCLSLQAIASRFLAGLLAGLFFALSLLTYEVFHGQFFAILFIGAIWIQAREGHPIDWLRSAAWPCLFVVAAQAAVLAYTAILGISKPLAPGWLAGWQHSFTNLPSILFLPNGVYRPAAFLIGVGVMAIGFMLVSKRVADALWFGFALSVITAAIAVAILVFAVGGYAQAPNGMMSRSTLAVGLWLSFGIFVLSYGASQQLPSIALFKVDATRFIALPLLALLAVQYDRTQSVWAELSVRLDQVMKAAPVEQLKNIPFGASLVYLGPSAYGGQDFMDSYVLGIGLAFHHRTLTEPGRFLATMNPAARAKIWTIRAYVRSDGQQYKWDGKELRYVLPGYWSFTDQVSKLFVWTASNEVKEVEPGWSTDLSGAASR